MKTNPLSSVFFVLGAFAAACHVQAQPLATVIVRPHAVDLTLPVEATVEAVAQSTLTAQVSGRVMEMRVDAGQSVKKGELLMRIDAREAGEVVASASAQFINAKANYERLQNLRKQGFISAAALDKAKADFEAAQATRGQAGVNLAYASVTAPISGLVAQRLIEQGETAAPGRPLLTIYDPNGLRVTASIPQYQLPQIRNVKDAKVEFPELGQWVTAQSVSLLPTADIKNVIPGMFARVHFVIGRAERMTVPASAVVRRGEVAAVYVQNAQGALSLRQLRLGELSAGNEIEVLAGLTSGELVVLDPIRAAIVLKSPVKATAKP